MICSFLLCSCHGIWASFRPPLFPDTTHQNGSLQALEAATWTALLKAPRGVLAGDHLQLPPTVISEAAAKRVRPAFCPSQHLTRNHFPDPSTAWHCGMCFCATITHQTGIMRTSACRRTTPSCLQFEVERGQRFLSEHGAHPLFNHCLCCTAGPVQNAV